jgi:hypothetical protein
LRNRTYFKPWLRRGLLLGLLLAILPAASPYFGSGEVPRTNDLFPHLYRVLALDLLVREGTLWPRWSPDLVHGFGYPVFNFFPSLSHWAVELFHLLGLPLTTAYRLVVVVHLWLAAVGAYALGRVWLRPAAAWLVGLAYAYSPYMLYDFHVRGSLPEGQALALLPVLLFAIWQTTQISHREEREGRQELKPKTLRSSRLCGEKIHHQLGLQPLWHGLNRWTAITALLFAATLLSHPVIYPLMFPVGLWLLVLAWRHGWRSLVGPTAGLGIGVLLSAFLWLPAIMEAGFTRAAVTAEQGYNYQDNFLTLAQLFDWPRLPADPALLNPPVVRSLPLVALLLALFFLVGWLWRRGPSTSAQRQVLFDWGLILVAATCLMLPIARPVWDTVPLLAQTLFPWRFLALASLAGAMLLGLAVDLFWGTQRCTEASQRGVEEINQIPDAAEVGAAVQLRTTLYALLLTAVLITTSIPWLFPPQEPLPEAPTRADLAANELPPLFVGTTTLGEYLPRWVEQIPDTAEMKTNLLADRHFDRLQLQDGLAVLTYDGSPTDARYRITVGQPITLTYRQFYFPGWEATLNGQSLTLIPGRPHGLIETAVPAGSHTLHIRFGTTPVRQAGALLSGLGLLLILLVLWRFPVTNKANQVLNNGSMDVKPHHFLLWGVVGLAIWFLFANVETPLRRTTLLPAGVYGLPQMTPLDYAGEIRLLTYEPQQISQPAEQPVPITLYWQAQRPIGVSYLVGVQVVDEHGVVWSRETLRPYNWRFISGNNPWPLDGYRMDPFEMELLDGTPPGRYHFLVGLVREDTGQTIAAHEFGQIEITEPVRGERPLEAQLTPPSNPAGPGLMLLGTRLDRNQAAPGDPLRLTLLWQIDDPAAIPTDRLKLALHDAAGNSLWERETAVSPTYPPRSAQPADRLRTELIVRLPASIPGGQHTWYAELGAAVWPIGSITINEPDRSFTPPELTHPVNQPLGDVATLLGAILTDDHLPSSVHLIWRAEAESAVSYRVFLHLIGPDGQIVAQSDGEPAHWGRPTTGWLPGEIVVDERVLSLPDAPPAGEYRLLAGLYDPASGQRLTTPDGADAVLITVWP